MTIDVDATLHVLRALLERMAAPQTDSDDLVRLPGPLERAAAAKLVRDGDRPAATIGRHVYARRSDLLALVDKLAKPTPAPVAVGGELRADLAAIAAREREPRLRKPKAKQ
jgi:hypothetical protein